MFDLTFVIHHGLALAVIAIGIAALVMRDVGWLVFSAWMILTVALYILRLDLSAAGNAGSDHVGHRLRSVRRPNGSVASRPA